MLCVDYEISEKMKDKSMDYIRYVDDMVFFSDNKQELEGMVSEVQRILGKYRLRINGSKTECRNMKQLNSSSQYSIIMVNSD